MGSVDFGTHAPSRWMSSLTVVPTPLAAAGLIIIMIGATAATVMNGMTGPALLPAVVGLLCVFIAYGRWKVAPLRA